MSLSTWLRDVSETRLKRRTLSRWRARPEIDARVQAVLALDPEALRLRAGAGDPRGLPGNAEFVASGWTEHMLLRYFLAFEHAEGASVLDTCSGLGWGSYLVASVGREVIGIDVDEGAVSFCKSTWQDPNLDFVQGSVLELPFDEDRFDVVLCMEAIEHFSRADGRRFLAELQRVCRPGGVLVGSSAFVETRAQADELCAMNEHHLYIYTRKEMQALVGEVFCPPFRLTRHYFAATKAGA
jgi:2-polyprenyl-3-methyl-5-hydroxy-6-metoxy-1,4-benzoquinol methylase